MSSIRVKVVEGESSSPTRPPSGLFPTGIRLAPMGLIATLAIDRKAKFSERAAFLGLAFSKAIERARKLGWMV
jgi:hypothetical protein